MTQLYFVRSLASEAATEISTRRNCCTLHCRRVALPDKVSNPPASTSITYNAFCYVARREAARIVDTTRKMSVSQCSRID